MEDKDLAKIDQLLAQMQASIAEIRSALPILTAIPPQVRSNGVLRAALRRQVSAAQQYMSGRWHKRDGNVYGTDVQAPGVKDAYSPPGDLRPPDQR